MYRDVSIIINSLIVAKRILKLAGVGIPQLYRRGHWGAISRLRKACPSSILGPSPCDPIPPSESSPFVKLYHYRRTRDFVLNTSIMDRSQPHIQLNMGAVPLAMDSFKLPRKHPQSQPQPHYTRLTRTLDQLLTQRLFDGS
jgi:hypothetical protein